MNRTHKLLLAAATAFWLWYWIVQDVLGPFGADDTFFLHMFWMMRHGLHQYTDFYSYHLPAYFQIVMPFLPAGDGLGFAWWFRGLAVVIVGAYAAMTKPAQWPFLLMFPVFGGIASNRPDTFGLLLFNFAWFLLLKDRRNLLLAAALASLSILFSARAGLMMAGLCPLLLWLARNNRREVLGLFVLGAFFVAHIGAIALHDPTWFRLVIRAVYIDASNMLPRLTFIQRINEVERLALVGMIVTALTAAIVALRRDPKRVNAQIIAAACAMELTLIFIDPLPFGYVYSWAVIPTLAGLSLGAEMIGAAAMAWAAMASVGAMLTLAVSYGIRKGAPPISHYLRFTLDYRMPRQAFEHLSTPRLVAFMMQQSGPWNQLAAREELCRRIKGPVVAYFWYQPICLDNAIFNWVGVTTTDADLARAMRESPPELVIWGEARPWPRALLRGYVRYPGFALRAGSTTLQTPQPRRR